MKTFNQHISQHIKILSILVLIGMLFCPIALAHKASIFAWVQGDTIHTQSKMTGGKRPKQALVEVFDENGTLLVQGRTDAQGQFSFPTPQKSDLKIVLNAGAGHRATWSLNRDDFLNADPNVIQAHAHEKPVHSDPGQISPPQTSMAKSVQAEMLREEMATLVATTLDQKLAPVMAKLAEMEQKQIKTTDIIGGLGYIIGLVGLAAYMHYRRQIKSKNT